MDISYQAFQRKEGHLFCQFRHIGRLKSLLEAWIFQSGDFRANNNDRQTTDKPIASPLAHALGVIMARFIDNFLIWWIALSKKSDS